MNRLWPQGVKRLSNLKKLRVNIFQSWNPKQILWSCSLLTNNMLFLKCPPSLIFWPWTVFLIHQYFYNIHLMHSDTRLSSIWTALTIALYLSAYLDLTSPFFISHSFLELWSRNRSGERKTEERAVTLVLMSKSYLWKRMAYVRLSHTLIHCLFFLSFFFISMKKKEAEWGTMLVPHSASWLPPQMLSCLAPFHYCLMLTHIWEPVHSL